MEGDPISIEEELENIASVLRKLITADDEPLDRTSKVDGGVSNASASSSLVTRRIFDEEKTDESNAASNASSADKLDWSPLFDSVESLKAASLSNFNLRRLFLEGKDAATSTSHLALRRLLEVCDKAAPESLSDCRIDPELKESLGDLGIRCLFREEKPTAASLSDFGIGQLHEDAATSAATIANPPDDNANGKILMRGRRLTRAAQDVSKAKATVATARRKILIAKRRLTRTGPLLVSNAAGSRPLQDRWKRDLRRGKGKEEREEDREKAEERKMEENESDDDESDEENGAEAAEDAGTWSVLDWLLGDDDESDEENGAEAAEDAGTWFVLNWLLGGDEKKDGAQGDDEGGVVASKSFGTRLIGRNWLNWLMRENEGKDGAESDEVVVADNDESGALEKNDAEEESGSWRFLEFLIRALFTVIFVMAVLVHIGRENATGDETNLTWFWVDEDDVTSS